MLVLNSSRASLQFTSVGMCETSPSSCKDKEKNTHHYAAKKQLSPSKPSMISHKPQVSLALEIMNGVFKASSYIFHRPSVTLIVVIGKSTSAHKALNELLYQECQWNTHEYNCHVRCRLAIKVWTRVLGMLCTCSLNVGVIESSAEQNRWLVTQKAEASPPAWLHHLM